MAGSKLHQVATVPVFAGNPTRTDYHYAIEVVGLGMIKMPGFDYQICEPNEQPWHTEEFKEATDTRKRVEQVYAKLGVGQDVVIVRRPIHTFVGDWQAIDIGS